MHIVSWNKELETGIEIVDSQHKQFLIKANTFIIKYLAEKKTEAIFEELEFIQDYLMYHFQTEETFQVDSCYPGYLDHQAEHKHLVFRVQEMVFMLQKSEHGETAIEAFAQFINEWVLSHILDEDLKFAKFYSNVHKN